MQPQSTKTWVKSLYSGNPQVLAVALVHAEKLVAHLTSVWNRAKNKSPVYVDRYRELVRVADIEISNVLEKAGGIPCRQGCNYCCRNEKIPVTDTEAVLIVRHIEDVLAEPVRERVIQSILSAGRTSDLASEPCAFLIDGQCAIYDSRPMPCRTYFSASEASCKTFFDDKSKQPEYFTAPKLVEYAVMEVSRAFKYAKSYEINGLFYRIYSDPSKPGMWKEGAVTDESSVAES